MCTVLHAAPSLKSATSEIVFRMCNKEKVLFDLVSSCRPVEIDPDFDTDFDFEFD